MNFANNEMAIITALLFQQFELELLDRDTKPVYGVGAQHPAPTRIRYRRKWGPVADRLEALAFSEKEPAPPVQW